jgi:outer membrane protein assembly factor BamD (BamD/ComL family)
LQNAEKTYRQFIEKYPNSPIVEDVKATLENLGLTPEELVRKFEEAN